MNLNQEMTARERAIDEIFGSRLRKDLDALNVTINDYSHDMKLVVEHFTKFLVGQSNLNVINQDALREWKRDSPRLLRNYLATRMTLRDHTYVLTKKYWEADEKEGRAEDADFMDPYRAKVKELLIKPQFSFLQDLRNYGVHVSLYPFVLNTKFAGGYMKNEIHLDKAQLLDDYSSWTSPAKKYINYHENRVDLLTPMEEWSVACKKFYEWMHGAVTVHHMTDFEAVEKAAEDYREWRRETGTMPPDWFLNGGEPPHGDSPARPPRSRQSASNSRKKRKRKQRKRR